MIIVTYQYKFGAFGSYAFSTRTEADMHIRLHPKDHVKFTKELDVSFAHAAAICDLVDECCEGVYEWDDN